MTDGIEYCGKRACVVVALTVMALAGCKSEGTKAPAADQASTSKPTGTTQKSTKPAEPSLPAGFTCCNFHYEGDWISDSNYTTLPMIPVGTPAKVTKYARHRAYADIGGKQMRLGHDYGRDQEKLEQWTAKMIVADDPKIKIATFPDAIKNAIRQGKITKGMTKEQVIMSLGYPPTHRTASTDLNTWVYWSNRWVTYEVHFGEDGKVVNLVGNAPTHNQPIAAATPIPGPPVHTIHRKGKK